MGSRRDFYQGPQATRAWICDSRQHQTHVFQSGSYPGVNGGADPIAVFRNSMCCYPYFNNNIYVQPHLAAITAVFLQAVTTSGHLPTKGRILETLITNTNGTDLVYCYPNIAIAQSPYCCFLSV